MYDLFIKPATPLSLIHNRSKGLKALAGTSAEIAKEGLLTTGAMRPTEMFNRVIASTMGTRMLDIHLDNMIGRKSIMNKGVPKEVIVESKKKMRAINSAWDQIQKLKSN